MYVEAVKPWSEAPEACFHEDGPIVIRKVDVTDGGAARVSDGCTQMLSVRAGVRRRRKDRRPYR
jgi:hypothetical protein